MRRFARISRSVVVVLIIFLSLSYQHVNDVQSAEFTSSSILFYRAKISQSNVQTFVVIRPSSDSSSRSENIVRIQFASGYSIASTATSIVATTVGIPNSYQGVSLLPMPGLSSTATNVSGQQVEFSVSDLSAASTYGFFITSGITTPVSSGRYVHILSTRDGSGQIDVKHISTSVVDNDQLTVSASVPASSSDGEMSIVGSEVEGTTLHESDSVEFTVSYKSLLSSSQPFTIVASWDKAQVVGSNSNLIDIFDYVVGSATDGYGGTSPVIDLQNRTITWTISSLPPSSSSNTVSFQLRVKSTIPTSSQLSVNVNVNGEILSTPLPEDEISFFILKTAQVTTPTIQPPTATNAPNVTSATSTPTPILSSSPTQAIKPLFERVEMEHISQSTAKVNFSTNIPVVYNVFYGLKQDNLSSQLSHISSDRNHVIEFSSLEPNTQYYFKIVAEDQSEQLTTSDIFSFKTASNEEDIILEGSTVLWKQLQLGYVSQARQSYDLIVSKDRPLTLTFTFLNSDKIEEIFLRIVDRDILGINTFLPPVQKVETKLIESLPGVFTAEILSPENVGNYQFEIEIHDIYGGFYTKSLGYNLHTSDPISVFDRQNNKPIENAKVNILRYQEHKKIYTRLDEIISYNSYTNENGILDMSLSQGRYLFEVEAVGYKKSVLETSIDAQHTSYPSFYLKEDSSLRSVLTGIHSTYNDLVRFNKYYFKNISVSQRVQTLLMGTNFITIVILLLTSLLMKSLVYSHGSNIGVDFTHWIVSLLIIFFINLVIIVSIFLTLIIWKVLGLVSAIPFIITSGVMMVLSISILVGIWKLYFKK